jgi:hypothetical protein
MSNANQPFTDGEDVESALDIIEKNGGTGEWEEARGEDAAGAIQRWMFPRFEGATETADMYLSRTGLGPYDTDVETIIAWASAPRNMVGAINLVGDPGGGKTALAEAAATHSDDCLGLHTHLCTPDDTRDSHSTGSGCTSTSGCGSTRASCRCCTRWLTVVTSCPAATSTDHRWRFTRTSV